MTIDPRVHPVIGEYLAEVDQAAPGLVTDFYVVGSAVLDDFRPGTSDVNFVAVLDPDRPQPACEALEAVHRQIAARGPAYVLDGVYVGADELLSSQARSQEGPHVRQGVFFRTGAHRRSVLDWYVFEGCGEAIRGDGLAATPTWFEVRRLDAAVLDRARQSAAAFLEVSAPAVSPGAERDPRELSSQVLAMTRLHYNLSTGKLCSKTKAGLYGLVAFTAEWSPLLDTALRVRRDPLSRTSELSVESVAAYLTMVLTDMALLL